MLPIKSIVCVTACMIVSCHAAENSRLFSKTTFPTSPSDESIATARESTQTIGCPGAVGAGAGGADTVQPFLHDEDSPTQASGCSCRSCCRECGACCAAIRRVPFKRKAERRALAHTKSHHITDSRLGNNYSSGTMARFRGMRAVAWCTEECPSLMKCIAYLFCCVCLPWCKPAPEAEVPIDWVYEQSLTRQSQTQLSQVNTAAHTPLGSPNTQTRSTRTSPHAAHYSPPKLLDAAIPGATQAEPEG